MNQTTSWMVVIAFFLVSVAVAIPAESAVTSVQIRVDGLACPFCAYGLEKKIKNHFELEEYDVDFDRGLVHVRLQREETFSIRQIRKAVKEAGFTYKNMRAAVRGTPDIVEDPNGNDALVLRDEEQGLDVLVADGSDTHEALFEQVRAEAFERPVEVVGTVNEHTKGAREVMIENNRTDFYVMVETFRKVPEEDPEEEKAEQKANEGDEWF